VGFTREGDHVLEGPPFVYFFCLFFSLCFIAIIYIYIYILQLCEDDRNKEVYYYSSLFKWPLLLKKEQNKTKQITLFFLRKKKWLLHVLLFTFFFFFFFFNLPLNFKNTMINLFISYKKMNKRWAKNESQHYLFILKKDCDSRGQYHFGIFGSQWKHINVEYCVKS